MSFHVSGVIWDLWTCSLMSHSASLLYEDGFKSTDVQKSFTSFSDGGCSILGAGLFLILFLTGHVSGNVVRDPWDIAVAFRKAYLGSP